MSQGKSDRGVCTLVKTLKKEKSVSVRRWTKAAIACYKRGCICSGCYYKSFFKGSPQNCKMKLAVLELVRVLGRPEIEPASAIIN